MFPFYLESYCDDQDRDSLLVSLLSNLSVVFLVNLLSMKYQNITESTHCNFLEAMVTSETACFVRTKLGVVSLWHFCLINK